MDSFRVVDIAAPAASQGKPGSWDRRVAQAAMLQFISDEIAALASRDAARDAIEYLEAMEFYATHGKIPTPDKVCLGASEHPQSLADLMPITALQDGDSAAAASTMTINCDASILELESASTSAATSPTKSPMRAAAAANKMNDFCDRLAAAPTLMAAAAAEAACAPVAEECAVDLLAEEEEEEEEADTDPVADPAESAQGCQAPARYIHAEESAAEAFTDEDLDDFSDSDYSDYQSDFELDDIVDGVLGATVGSVFGKPPAAPAAETASEIPAIEEHADDSSSAYDSSPATPANVVAAHDEALDSGEDDAVEHTREAVPDDKAAMEEGADDACGPWAVVRRCRTQSAREVHASKPVADAVSWAGLWTRDATRELTGAPVRDVKGQKVQGQSSHAEAGSLETIAFNTDSPVATQTDGKAALMKREGLQAVDATDHILPETAERASAAAVKILDLGRMAQPEGADSIKLPAGSSPAGTEEQLCNPYDALGKAFAGMVLYKRQEMLYFDESDMKLAKKESQAHKTI
eukprot:jgi/Ulvmu1/12296/UM088_0012.1